MEQKRLTLYTFSERQLILLNTCINAWWGSTFWASCICRSRLFHAETSDSIYRGASLPSMIDHGALMASSSLSVPVAGSPSPLLRSAIY